jgi:hypothetical protein
MYIACLSAFYYTTAYDKNEICFILSIYENRREGTAMTKEKARYGDVIFADHGLYKHYGVYAGEDKVIHYATPAGESKFADEARVREDTVADFLNGAETYGICEFSDDLDIGNILWNFCNPNHETLDDILEAFDTYSVYSPEDTVQRARNRLGETKYDLVKNNCEHFAVWCKTGVADSRQVDFLLGWVPVVRIITEWLKE